MSQKLYGYGNPNYSIFRPTFPTKYDIPIFPLVSALITIIYMVLIIAFYVTTFMYLKDQSHHHLDYRNALLLLNVTHIIIPALVMFCCCQKSVAMVWRLLFSAFVCCVAIVTMFTLITLLYDRFSNSNILSSVDNSWCNSPLICCAYYNEATLCSNKGPCLMVNITANDIPLVNNSPEGILTEIGPNELFEDYYDCNLGLGLLGFMFAFELVLTYAFVTVLKKTDLGVPPSEGKYYHNQRAYESTETTTHNYHEHFQHASTNATNHSQNTDYNQRKESPNDYSMDDGGSKTINSSIGGKQEIRSIGENSNTQQSSWITNVLTKAENALNSAVYAGKNLLMLPSKPNDRLPPRPRFNENDEQLTQMSPYNPIVNRKFVSPASSIRQDHQQVPYSPPYSPVFSHNPSHITKSLNRVNKHHHQQSQNYPFREQYHENVTQESTRRNFNQGGLTNRRVKEHNETQQPIYNNNNNNNNNTNSNSAANPVYTQDQRPILHQEPTNQAFSGPKYTYFQPPDAFSGGGQYQYRG